jgi:DHA2 family methylenomycin A resistance protein-like MFS transporter
VVGGLLVDLLGWRSVFWLNLPVGVIGFLLSVRALAAAPAKPSARIEPFGHMLGVIGLAGLAFTVIEGPALHWSSPVIIVSAVITVLAIVAFVVRERRVAEPMFPVQLFHNSRFTAANLINFLLCFGLYGIIFLLGLFFQQVRGADPMHGGLQMLPMMLVFVIGNLGFARVVPKTGTRVPMMVGLLLAGVVSVVLLWVSPTTPYWLLATAIAVGNLGLGVAAPASTAAMMDTVGQANAGIGGSTLNANKQVGALVGVAVMGAVLASGGGNWYSAARIDFGLSVLAYLVAGVIAARAFRGTR